MNAVIDQAPQFILRGRGAIVHPDIVNVVDDADMQFLLHNPHLINGALDAAHRGQLRKYLTWARTQVPPDFMRHALGYVTSLRNAQLDAITTAIGSNGLLRIYDGSRPATGGTATTLLAQLALSSTAAGAASSGVLTFSSITNDSSADATGTATWHRFATSGGSAVIDGSTGTSGADLNFNTVAFVSGAVIAVTSYTITAGNA